LALEKDQKMRIVLELLCGLILAGLAILLLR
jgi:hypothetical protein